jgi:hypothetical protein
LPVISAARASSHTSFPSENDKHVTTGMQTTEVTLLIRRKASNRTKDA